MKHHQKIYGPLNPLAAEPKREKTGSNTYRKYNYQYHWAFCRLLEAHADGQDYALFMEEHEDVTLANSLDINNARFEFNQVKETKSPQTIASLIHLDGKRSILGKMAEGVYRKSFSDKIKAVNLVSTGGFKFDLHEKGYDYEVITTGYLTDAEIDEIKKHLTKEIGHADLIANLAFVIPNLPAKDFVNATQGRIAALINKISPKCHYNTGYIYSCIIEDLQRKGENTFDYTDWDTALKKKAVTSAQVQQIINQNISRKDDAALLSQLNDILSKEYDLNLLARRKIMHAFNRYYAMRFGDRNLALNSVAEDIGKRIKEFSEQCNAVPELEKMVKNALSQETKRYFVAEDELTAAILYELLSGE